MSLTITNLEKSRTSFSCPPCHLFAYLELAQILPTVYNELTVQGTSSIFHPEKKKKLKLLTNSSLLKLDVSYIEF